MGVYFTKECAKKARKYLILRKVIQKQILLTVDVGDKVPPGAQDVYRILFKKAQNTNVKRLYTKKPSDMKKIFLQGELLKFRYADGIIGCEKIDLYMLKSEFGRFNNLKSEGYDWPLVLANNTSALKSLVRNTFSIISLTRIIGDLEAPLREYI